MLLAQRTLIKIKNVMDQSLTFRDRLLIAANIAKLLVSQGEVDPEVSNLALISSSR